MGKADIFKEAREAAEKEMPRTQKPKKEAAISCRIEQGVFDDVNTIVLMRKIRKEKATLSAVVNEALKEYADRHKNEISAFNSLMNRG